MSAHSRRVFVEFVQMCTFFKTDAKVEKYKYLAIIDKSSRYTVLTTKQSREFRLAAAKTVHHV